MAATEEAPTHTMTRIATAMTSFFIPSLLIDDCASRQLEAGGRQRRPAPFHASLPRQQKGSRGAGYWYHFSPIASYCLMLWPSHSGAFSMSRIIFNRFTDAV